MRRILAKEQIPDFIRELSPQETRTFFVDNQEGKYQVRRLE